MPSAEPSIDAETAMFDKDETIVHKRLRPKDAATLILVRRDAGAPRILMGQRHGAMAFQPNKYVFPGGRMDACDTRITAGGNLRPDVLAKLTGHTTLGHTRAGHTTAARARGLALAAIRETFEETGILVGTRDAAIPRTRSPAWKSFFAHGVVPELQRLHMIGRAITPPNRPRRFDARFFMAEADCIAHELETLDNDELLKPCWVSFRQARALDLPSITRRMIDEVEAHAEHGHDPARPVPFFRFLNGRALARYL
jgi:8-oxo-dGTP pyrophosphatase MutT (NUDIX family)